MEISYDGFHALFFYAEHPVLFVFRQCFTVVVQEVDGIHKVQRVFSPDFGKIPLRPVVISPKLTGIHEDSFVEADGHDVFDH